MNKKDKSEIDRIEIEIEIDRIEIEIEIDRIEIDGIEIESKSR